MCRYIEIMVGILKVFDSNMIEKELLFFGSKGHLFEQGVLTNGRHVPSSSLIAYNPVEYYFTFLYYYEIDVVCLSPKADVLVDGLPVWKQKWSLVGNEEVLERAAL